MVKLITCIEASQVISNSGSILHLTFDEKPFSTNDYRDKIGRDKATFTWSLLQRLDPIQVPMVALNSECP